MFPTRKVQALQREPKEQLEIAGGKSLRVTIVLSPASFSYPGLVTVNMCLLLALLAIAPIRVTECCPQSRRNRGRGQGTCSWLSQESDQAALPARGVWGSITTPVPRHRQPQRGIYHGLHQPEQPRALPVQRTSPSATFSRSTCSGNT